MQQFFVDISQIDDSNIYIIESDLNHMKNVLRMKPGEQVRICDTENYTYLCEIEGYGEDQAVLRILEKNESFTELAAKIYLFQGLPKQDKMELIIQKAVELGATGIIPVKMKRCVVKLDDKKADKKVARWNQISESAAKQSKRGIIPVVEDVTTYKLALEQAKKLDYILVPYENAEGMAYTKELIASIPRAASIGIFIGPEGGFDRSEIDLALEAGAKTITLGRRILRTETAGFTILSALMFHLEDDE